MLVRDIELVPAIVDLIDNSVDGARRIVGAPAHNGHIARDSDRDGNDAVLKPLEGYSVEVRINKDEFVVNDNCGGITLEDAENYAFRFGRPEKVEPIEGEVGQFGVGMKRALFKLGEWFSVSSTARTSQFTVDVDVEKWLNEKGKWRFPIVAAGRRASRRGIGTRIVVKRLFPSVAAEFGEELFVQRLRDQIEFRHSTAIEEGLTVKLNTHDLHSRPPTLLLGADVIPRVVHETLSSNGDSVEMNLYAGFVDLKDEDADTDDPEEFAGANLAGWYLICNGRMLLFADRSRLTGWGQEVADYHPQYRRFRGYVYLNGNSAAMPWNTAKTAVDEDNVIWRQVRSYIVDALRDARTIMNRIKTEVQENEEAARPITVALKASHVTRLATLQPNASITIPPKPPRRPPSTKRVTYVVSADEFDAVAESLNVTSKADVGRETFYFYYRREVEN
jgi:hypothetical protein